MTIRSLLTIVALLFPSIGLAECYADPLKRVDQAVAIVVGDVTSATPDADVERHRSSKKSEPLPYAFSIEVKKVLLGRVAAKNLRFRFPTRGGEDDDRFAVGSEWAFSLHSVQDDGTASLFGYRCMSSAIPTTAKELMHRLAEKIKAKEAAARNAEDPAVDRVIHLSALVKAPPAQAFSHFTDNEKLQSWLTTLADVEPKVGGKYEPFWDPGDRQNNSTIGCRVTALAPAQLIAFQWRSPKQFKALANAADPLTHVVVTFAPEGAGTRVHLVHSGWRSAPAWEEARAWQEKAWSLALKELTAKN
ncbi:MAG: SRPBCC domain-containing protein [Elusimicrobia bacterium]|nr:SRPBCC domain-containing protein [Elusimicrobiota bacterium]